MHWPARARSIEKERERKRPNARAPTPTTPTPPPLSKNKKTKTGYLAIPDFATPEEVQALRARAQELIAGADLTTAAASVFSTVKQQKKTLLLPGAGAPAANANDAADAVDAAADDAAYSSDVHFLESADRVSFFLEDKAVDEATGAVVAPRESAVNKIGHALHDRDATFRAFSRSPRVAALLRSLAYARPLPVQSMYIVKGPRIGGEVSPHRDDSFLATLPRPSVVGLWLALEPADRGNGCLWAVPGSHRDGGGEPERRFVLRREEEEVGEEGAARGERAEVAGGAAGGGGGAAAGTKNKATKTTLAFTAPQPEHDLSRAAPIECPAGTLVLLHGHVLHYSGENTSPHSRHSYTTHYVEGGKGLSWAGDNWLQRPGGGGGFEPLYGEEEE